ncbi:MAG: HIT family protein [Patescibacteria group bacterium]
MPCCNIWDKFNESKNLIREYKYWKLLVRNSNFTLGNCVVINKRHLGSLSEVTPEEMAELAQIAREIEPSLKKSFSYDNIHWLLLMNHEKHIHFHIIPRYSRDKEFAGVIWKDPVWPSLIKSEIKQPPASQETLNQIKKEILKNF